MSHITVSPAGPDTVKHLVASVTELFREDAGQHDPNRDLDWPTRDGIAYYTGLLNDPSCLLALAHRDHHVVGHLIGKLREPDAILQLRLAILESMRVDPTTRGQGVGGQLVEAFFHWARQHHAQQASVNAYAANHGAQRFYTRHGFTPHDITLRTTL